MKVLNINAWGISGKRFNGISLKQPLADLGIDSESIVWEEHPADSNVTYFGGKLSYIFTLFLRKVENNLSIQSILQFHNPIRLFLKKRFRNSNIIHYHIIHNGYFSLLALPFLTKFKPSVWTLHDPWAMTGHCIHPLECEKWQTGCQKCPLLEVPLEMRRDNTKFMFWLKKKIFSSSKIDLIVSSNWMLSKVIQSPLLRHCRVHYVPFGIDLDYFKPLDSIAAKKSLGIEPETVVLTFRAIKKGFKGFEYIEAALEKLKTDKKICLITFTQQGLLEKFNNKMQLLELGHCNDDALLRIVLNATDIFLMPSIAESFGMMAVEAMACGKPVISFEGTALTEITFAPDCGISVPMKNSDALADAIQRLMDNPAERLERGKKGREIAEKNYDIKLQAERTAKIYRSLLNR